MLTIGEIEVHYDGEKGDYVPFHKGRDNYIQGRISRAGESDKALILEVVDLENDGRSYIQYDKFLKVADVDISGEKLLSRNFREVKMVPIKEFFKARRANVFWRK